jgi:copper homeostasis protein
MSLSVKTELCAASIEAIQIASTLKLDRIELCQSLEQGGLTPSAGLIEYAIKHGLETHVLIRPRAAGFDYNKDEIDLMLKNIVQCKLLGAHGVVVGVLDEHNKINKTALDLMVEKADGMDVTFHRAIDDTMDYKDSIDTLIASGVKRILSSGLENNVDQGCSNLAAMKRYSNARIEIMPGGGINEENIKRIVTEVKPDAIHFSGTVKYATDPDSKFATTILKVDSSRIEKLLNLVT